MVWARLTYRPFIKSQIGLLYCAKMKGAASTDCNIWTRGAVALDLIRKSEAKIQPERLE
jgi:hypothetical protein